MWRGRCLSMGMTILLILLTIQVLITLLALVFETGEDSSFEGDKLMYRS